MAFSDNWFEVFKSRLWVVLLLLCLHACTAETIDPKLMERFHQYYEYEKTHDWDKAYEMRAPAFRKVVGKEYYLKEMEKDYAGFDLLDYQIIGSDIGPNGIVTFRVKFTHNHPKSRAVESKANPDGGTSFKLEFNGESDGKTSNIEANSVWRKIDGVWYVRDAATRIKLSLNANME